MLKLKSSNFFRLLRLRLVSIGENDEVDGIETKTTPAKEEPKVDQVSKSKSKKEEKRGDEEAKRKVTIPTSSDFDTSSTELLATLPRAAVSVVRRKNSQSSSPPSSSSAAIKRCRAYNYSNNFRKTNKLIRRTSSKSSIVSLSASAASRNHSYHRISNKSTLLSSVHISREGSIRARLLLGGEYIPVYELIETNSMIVARKHRCGNKIHHHHHKQHQDDNGENRIEEKKDNNNVEDDDNNRKAKENKRQKQIRYTKQLTFIRLHPQGLLFAEKPSIVLGTSKNFDTKLWSSNRACESSQSPSKSSPKPIRTSKKNDNNHHVGETIIRSPSIRSRFIPWNRLETFRCTKKWLTINLAATSDDATYEPKQSAIKLKFLIDRDLKSFLTTGIFHGYFQSTAAAAAAKGSNVSPQTKMRLQANSKIVSNHVARIKSPIVSKLATIASNEQKVAATAAASEDQQQNSNINRHQSGSKLGNLFSRKTFSSSTKSTTSNLPPQNTPSPVASTNAIEAKANKNRLTGSATLPASVVANKSNVVQNIYVKLSNLFHHHGSTPPSPTIINAGSAPVMVSAVRSKSPTLSLAASSSETKFYTL